MGAEIVRKKQTVQKAVGQGSADVPVTGSAMLGGNAQVVHITAQPVLTSVEAQAGGVSAQGTVEMRAAWLDENKQLRGRTVQQSFSTVIPVEEAQAGDDVRALVSVSGAEGKTQDGRLEMHAGLHLEALVTRREESAWPVDLRADGLLETRTVMVNVALPDARAQVREPFAEVFALADEGYTRVALWEAQPVVQRVTPLDGAVEVSGEVALEALLAGEGADDPVGWQTERIPFQVEIAQDEFTSDAQVSVTARVREGDVRIEEQQVEETTERELRVDYVLEVTARAPRSSTEEVLQDAFPPSEEPFDAEQESVEVIDLVEDAEQDVNIELDVTLPEDAPRIRTLVGTFAAPIALDAVGGDDARAEGLLRITLLYRTQGEQELTVYETEQPFSVAFGEISGLSQVYSVSVSDVEGKRVSPTQVKVRVELEMEALRAQTAAVHVMKEIRTDGEPAVLPTGAVLYYPDETETMWDVAKRYRMPMQKVLERNPAGESPVLIYRRLTDF